MKVKVRRRQIIQSVPQDAMMLYLVKKMPGEVYQRICLKYGKEDWLLHPSYHGMGCPSSGDNPGIECRCDECDHYLTCFPDWRSRT